MENSEKEFIDKVIRLFKGSLEDQRVAVTVLYTKYPSIRLLEREDNTFKSVVFEDIKHIIDLTGEDNPYKAMTSVDNF